MKTQQPPEVLYGLCPLCTQRPTDTTVYYDEVLSSRTTAIRSSRRGGVRYSSSSLSQHGNIRLCGQCAKRYEDSVASRKLGRRLLNWGTALLLGGSLLFLVLLENTQGTVLELALTLPVLVGIVLVGSAAGLLVAGNGQKGPMTRYLREKAKQ